MFSVGMLVPPVMYESIGVVAVPLLGILLISAATGYWLALRILTDKSMPAGGTYPLGDLYPQLYELMPAIVGLSVSGPAFTLIFRPLFQSADAFHVFEAPAIISPWLVAWLSWNWHGAREMRVLHLLTPIVIVVGVIGYRGADYVASWRVYVASWQAFTFLAHLGWLALTSVWLIGRLKRIEASAERD